MSMLIYEILILAVTIGLFIYMKKKGYRNVGRKFLLIIIGALLFEFMTEPIWVISEFSSWTYIYKDISMMLTLGWVNIIVFCILLVDYTYGHLPEKRRFWLYLLYTEVLAVLLSIYLVSVGALGYASELTSSISGVFIPLTIVPVETVFVFPMFISLVITFYKYVNYLINKS